MDPLLIQRPPLGLLDLLGLKGVGQAPIRCNDTVTPTLADCVDYYLAPRRETLSAITGVAMAANTAYTVQSVPSGEIWFVYSFAVRLNAATAPATAIRFWGTYSLPASSGTPIPATDVVDVGASDNGVAYQVYSRPMIFPPGCQFGMATGAVTGAPGSNGRIFLDVARLVL